MMRILLAAVALTAGAVAGPSTAAPATHDTSQQVRDLPSWTTRPCATEDSVNCAWDAATRGNGTGHSFIVRQVPGRARMVCVFYAARRYARTHDYCTRTR